MPWQTLTLNEIRKNNRDYISGKTGGAPLIPNSTTRVLADANGGNAHLVLQYIANLAKQLLPDTADGDWLRNRHAKIWLGGWKQATYASGLVLLSGTAGITVLAGTQLSGLSSGVTVLYATTSDIVIGSGPTEAPVKALTAGAQGNCAEDSSLSVTSAQPGLNGTAKVVSITGGTDEEETEDLRTRVLERIRLPPMGGDADDYVAWTKSVPGVTRAWCSPGEMGVGTVTVRFMMDDLRASTGGFPNADDLYAVKVYLDMVRPVATKDLFVVSPVAYPISFRLSNIGGDSSASRAALEKAVASMLREKAAPAHAINGTRQDAQTIYAVWVSEAISSVPEIAYFDLNMQDAVMPHAGAMAALGQVIYA